MTFNLSEKIDENYSDPKDMFHFIKINDVKEFIRLVKEEITDTIEWTDAIEKIWDKLNELAGPELR